MPQRSCAKPAIDTSCSILSARSLACRTRQNLLSGMKERQVHIESNEPRRQSSERGRRHNPRLMQNVIFETGHVARHHNQVTRGRFNEIRANVQMQVAAQCNMNGGLRLHDTFFRIEG